MRIGCEPITSRRKLSDLLRSMTMAASVTPTRSVKRSPSTAKSVSTWPTSMRLSSGEPMTRLVRCPSDLGGKRQGVGPEQLGRLGRARERKIRGRRRAGADRQADSGVRPFGGLVDAAEHRLAAGADQQARAAVLGRHDGHRHGHLIAEPLTEHHRHRAFGDPLGRKKVGRVGGIGIPAVDDVEGRALVILAGGRLLRFRLGADDVTGQAVDEAAEQQRDQGEPWRRQTSVVVGLQPEGGEEVAEELADAIPVDAEGFVAEDRRRPGEGVDRRARVAHQVDGEQLHQRRHELDRSAALGHRARDDLDLPGHHVDDVGDRLDRRDEGRGVGLVDVRLGVGAHGGEVARHPGQQFLLVDLDAVNRGEPEVAEHGPPGAVVAEQPGQPLRGVGDDADERLQDADRRLRLGHVRPPTAGAAALSARAEPRGACSRRPPSEPACACSCASTARRGR